MSQEQQFVSVPVPIQHVTQVYAFLAELAGITTGPSAETTATPLDDGEWPFVEWGVQDLRKLTQDALDSVQVVTGVLDILAKQPGERVSYTSLVELLNVDRKRLRGVLSAFTRVVHKHYGRRNWPMTWVEAPSEGTDLKSEFYYTVSETTAARWREVRTQS
ncbi:hypothetical protein [Streptomyces rubellomurinus]|uniref:Uncharacterized protein n=1 Tax=Streptomyces rubellomurinus (strain ATCC 31215) TaxID=359131 RepID=A0A0F2TG66_STRR3|nr:hypothetical protein [Streptomyces rubellomurinus]KJS60702.1 hypothetical protein VM95_19235 [Streptomyces rubellomurinus]